MRPETRSCSECSQLNCYQREKHYPDFCLTESSDENSCAAAIARYQGNGLDARIARATAELQGEYYGKLTRIEEIIAFAYRMGAQKIGIASCLGLIDETRIFVRVLRLAGFDTYTALCKVGSVDKTDIGIIEEKKIQPGRFEAACNPILQATLLNQQLVDLNVIVGLCVGHDSLFIKNAEAPVTTLLTKDVITGHNPAAALYTTRTCNKRLLDAEYLRSLNNE